MKNLLIMTVGQTDVQVVMNDQRHKLDGNHCGTMHDEIRQRRWSVIDAPKDRNRDFIKKLPDADLKLCTPKLDAVLSHLGSIATLSTLIFETCRQDPRDPRLAGEVVARRLCDRGFAKVTRVAFLTGTEQLEDSTDELDTVVRRGVVETLSNAIRENVKEFGKDDKVFVATTGGLAAANELINELARLHAVGGPTVIVLEVPDRDRVAGEDRAVEEKFHPAAGFRARWHALSLIENGNLLGAWGAVSHLRDIPGQGWTHIVKSLADFASSMPFDPPLPSDSDLLVLNHNRLAVRAALRVEWALRAGDIPRAVHGTVAFFESALWDKLGERLERHPDGQKKRFFKVKNGDPPTGEKLLRVKGATDNGQRPFELKPTVDDVNWYWVYDGDGGPGARIAEQFLKSKALTELVRVLARKNGNGENIYSLRNDVAHNEPTPALMRDASSRMRAAKLWSSDSDDDRFLTQPLVQDVLTELGVAQPADLWHELAMKIRRRLLAIH
jgi:hypothetical protein